MHYTMRTDNGAEYGPVDVATLRQWAQQKRVPKSALLIPAEGGAPRSVLSVPELAAILDPQAPPTEPGPITRPVIEDAGMSRMIPYRNGAALAAYYTGIFAFIPALGILLGLAGLVLGIIGLRNYNRDPRVHGTVHA